MAKKLVGVQFKPGQSGNPNGRPRVPEEIKEARKLTKIEFERLANVYIHMNLRQLRTASKDPAATGLERMIIKIVQDGAKHGKIWNIEFLLDRLIGKVKENLNLSGSLDVNNLTDEQLEAKIAEKLALSKLK